MKRFKYVCLIIFNVVILALYAPSCSKDENPLSNTQPQATPGMDEQIKKNDHNVKVEQELDEKKDFEEKAQLKLDEFNRDIEELKAKAKDTTGESRTELNQAINKLETLEEGAREKLDKLKSASAGAWKQLKEDVQYSIDEIDKEYDEITIDIHKETNDKKKDQ